MFTKTLIYMMSIITLTNFFQRPEFQITCRSDSMYHEQQMIHLFRFTVVDAEFVNATFNNTCSETADILLNEW